MGASSSRLFLWQRNTPTTRGSAKWPSYKQDQHHQLVNIAFESSTKGKKSVCTGLKICSYSSSLENMKNQTSIKFQTYHPTDQKLLVDLISNARLRKGCALCEKEELEQKKYEFRRRAKTIGCGEDTKDFRRKGKKLTNKRISWSENLTEVRFVAPRQEKRRSHHYRARTEWGSTYYFSVSYLFIAFVSLSVPLK